MALPYENSTAGAAGIDAYCKAGGRKVNNATFIAVIAEPRYWEDATINGKVDEDGSLVPCRNGTCWEPVIRLEDGLIQNWPQGTTASIHYKVCDQGLYWLLDADGNRIAKWRGDYVPDEFLCHGDNGHGDYIIFAVNGSGFIENWRRPQIDEGEWQAIEHDGKHQAQPPADTAAAADTEPKTLGDLMDLADGRRAIVRAAAEIGRTME